MADRADREQAHPMTDRTDGEQAHPMTHGTDGEQAQPMTERVDREQVIPAPLDEVWQAITGDGWLADRVELDLVPGGDARFVTGEHERTGWVEEAQPPEESRENGQTGARLVFWWSVDAEPATRVALRLDPEGGGATRLSLTESRPLEVLDLIGVPLRESGGGSYGPSLLVAA